MSNVIGAGIPSGDEVTLGQVISWLFPGDTYPGNNGFKCRRKDDPCWEMSFHVAPFSWRMMHLYKGLPGVPQDVELSLLLSASNLEWRIHGWPVMETYVSYGDPLPAMHGEPVPFDRPQYKFKYDPKATSNDADEASNKAWAAADQGPRVPPAVGIAVVQPDHYGSMCVHCSTMLGSGIPVFIDMPTGQTYCALHAPQRAIPVEPKGPKTATEVSQAVRDEFLKINIPPPKKTAWEALPHGIHATLAERGSNYGAFSSHAKIAQDVKDVMRNTAGWAKLAPDQKECLEMFAHKAARLLNGNPDWLDGWRDLIGYTQLVFDRMKTTDGVTDARIVKQVVRSGKLEDV